MVETVPEVVEEAKEAAPELVEDVRHYERLERLIRSHKYLAVDFYGTFCPPCKVIAPEFEALARVYQECVFVKVNIEKVDCSKMGIRMVPTFYFYSNGAKRDELVGCDKTRLRGRVQALVDDFAERAVEPTISGF